MLTEEKINEIKARVDAATPGPWVYDETRDEEDYCIITQGLNLRYEDADTNEDYKKIKLNGVVGSSEWIWIKKEDARFIAAAREDIPLLIKEIEKHKKIHKE